MLLAVLAPLVVAVGGAVLVTWPLAPRLADHLVVPGFFIGQAAVPTSPDTYLHLYILAWVHHALAGGAALFDANVMYPAAGALAGSEHMLGHWPVHGPVYAETANPVVAYNWVLLSSFVLNALAMHALVWRWTGSAPAGLVAAAVYAWAPLRFAMIDTVQHLNVAYLPLLLLCADRWWERRSVPALVAVALLAAWQALCSYYLAYATAVLVAVLAAAALLAGRGAARGRLAALVGAGLLGLVPTALLARPYLALRAGGAVPEYGDAWLRAASASPAWLLSPDAALFTGYLALAFAVVGLVASERLLGRFRALLLVVMLVAGFVLVLGPTLTVGGVDLPLPYRLLHLVVPGFASLRYPYRFGVLSTLALAVLAGTGFAAVWRHAGAAAWALAAAAVVVVGLEYRQAPLRLVPTDVGVATPTLRWLAEHGRGRPVLEWPIPPRPDFRAGYEQSRAMARSTHHWLPTLNGYTAYAPPSFGVVSGLAERLPDAESLATLIDVSGVELLVLHRDRLPAAVAPAWNRWLAGGACHERIDFGADVICALPAARRDLRPGLVAANAAPPRESVGGVPLAPLPAGQRAALDVPEPLGAFGAGLVTPLALAVENAGTAVWPGLAPPAPGVVVVRHRWRDAPEAGFASVPLLCDVTPGARCSPVVGIVAPSAAGRHELEIGLAQQDGAPIPLADGTTRVVAVDVRPVGRGAARSAARVDPEPDGAALDGEAEVRVEQGVEAAGEVGGADVGGEGVR